MALKIDTAKFERLKYIYTLPEPVPGSFEELVIALTGKKQVYLDGLGMWKEVPSDITLLEKYCSTAALPRINNTVFPYRATDQQIISKIWDATGVVSVTPLSKSVPALASLSPTFCRVLQNTPVPKRNRSLGVRAQSYHDYFNHPPVLTILGSAALDDGINVL